jgi:sugar O-acyltransferase (sialic acid O-acetyltransferase NeuD family)
MLSTANAGGVIIVGAGGLGREIYTWISSSCTNLSVLGFIDDSSSPLAKYDYPVGIISDIRNHIPPPKAVYVMAIMAPAAKQQISSFLSSRGCQFIQLIHPTVIIGRNVSLGEGVVIAPGCILTCDIKVGDFVFLNTQTTLGHDVIVGSNTSINGKVEVSGFVKIGENVTIGSSATVLPKKEICSGATIGAGSVVVGSIKQPTTVFGNPAKRI